MTPCHILSKKGSSGRGSGGVERRLTAFLVNVSERVCIGEIRTRISWRLVFVFSHNLSALSLSGMLKWLCQSHYDYLIGDNLMKPHFCLRYTTHKSIRGARETEKRPKIIKKKTFRFVSFSGLTIFRFAWSARSPSHLNWKFFGERDSWKKVKVWFVLDKGRVVAAFEWKKKLGSETIWWHSKCIRRAWSVCELFMLNDEWLFQRFADFYDWRIIVGRSRRWDIALVPSPWLPSLS